MLKTTSCCEVFLKGAPMNADQTSRPSVFQTAQSTPLSASERSESSFDDLAPSSNLPFTQNATGSLHISNQDNPSEDVVATSAAADAPTYVNLQEELAALEEKSGAPMDDESWQALLQQTQSLIQKARDAMEEAKKNSRTSKKALLSEAALLEWEHKLALGDAIRRRMRELDINQNALAHATGIGVGQISLIVNGKQNLTLRTLARLEVALDTRFDLSTK